MHRAPTPFWEKSETALLQALMLYLLHEAPPEEQNFGMVMELLGSAQVKEEDENFESPLDILLSVWPCVTRQALPSSSTAFTSRPPEKPPSPYW